jgi:hypothetical protein
MILNRVAAVGLVLALAACTSVRQVQPLQFIPQHTPALVWVTTTGDAVVPVARPQIDGDTLRGTWAGTDRPLAIPLQGIQSVQAKTPATARTILVGATLAVVTGAILWSVTKTGSSGQTVPCPSGEEEC